MTNLQIAPNLYGFGTETRAAYGNNQSPTICIVNTLDAYAPIVDDTRNGVAVKTGGLKTLIMYDVDNKVIIFEVSGNITVNGWLNIRNNYVTIAGQTAPSPGITIRNGEITILGHDVFVQHIRVRMDDCEEGPSYASRDCINIYSSNIIVDHCSVSWAADENIGMATENLNNSSVINCIIAEGLQNSGHPDGSHSMGLIAEGGINIGIVNNLFIHNAARNPFFNNTPRLTKTLIANNVIYNPERQNIHITTRVTADDWNIVGNVLIGGPNSGKDVSSKLPYFWWDTSNTTDMYIYDNRIEEVGQPIYTQNSADDWSRVGLQSGSDDEIYCKVLSLAFPYPLGYIPVISSEVENYVLKNVGARPIDRDSVDTRLITDVINGTGNIVDTVSFIPYNCTGLNTPITCCTETGIGNCRQIAEGGFPLLAENVKIHDDIPVDPHYYSDINGYTNLEKWLHVLAAKVENVSQEETPVVTNIVFLPEKIDNTTIWSALTTIENNNDFIVENVQLGFFYYETPESLFHTINNISVPALSSVDIETVFEPLMTGVYNICVKVIDE